MLPKAEATTDSTVINAPSSALRLTWTAPGNDDLYGSVSGGRLDRPPDPALEVAAEELVGDLGGRCDETEQIAQHAEGEKAAILDRGSLEPLIQDLLK